VVSALDASLTVGQALVALSNAPFTRLPVYESNLDTVLGMVLRPTLSKTERESGGDTKLSDLILPIHRVSVELPVLRLLDLFIKRREHMFLVEDRYGQTAGIVTLEDAIETLLGREIMDESDTVEDMQELARKRYRRRLQQQ
jgi:CBS domain containing-hemolysin-like protein